MAEGTRGRLDGYHERTRRGWCDVEMVRVEVPGVAIEEEDRLVVTPEGDPLAARLTVPVKPFDAAVEIVIPADAPGAMVRVFCEADTEKSCGIRRKQSEYLHLAVTADVDFSVRNGRHAELNSASQGR